MLYNLSLWRNQRLFITLVLRITNCFKFWAYLCHILQKSSYYWSFSKFINILQFQHLHIYEVTDEREIQHSYIRNSTFATAYVRLHYVNISIPMFYTWFHTWFCNMTWIDNSNETILNLETWYSACRKIMGEKGSTKKRFLEINRTTVFF